MEESQLINHEIGYFYESRKPKSKDWVLGIVAVAAIAGFVLIVLQLASQQLVR